MRKIIVVIFAFILNLFYLFLLASPTFATSASITISTPISPQGNISIAINGKEYDSFLLLVGNSGQEPSLTFTVNSNGCQKNSGGSTFISFSCKITDPNQKLWTVNTVRTGFPSGTYSVRLSSSQGFIANENFVVGNAVQLQTLPVSLNPTGPLLNDQPRELTISWTTGQSDKSFLITTTIPSLFALPYVKCSSSPCSTTITIPKDSLAGVHRITVEQEGDASIRGTATIEILSATVEKPTPIPTPTPKPTFAPPPNPCPGSSCPTAIGDISTDPPGFVGKLFAILLSLAGGVALVLIMISGYRLMVSEGNPEKVQAAREQLTSAIVGLLFVIFSITILQIIGVDILKIPGFQ